MSLLNNSPTFTYIQASGISVIWNEEVYMIADFHTNKKWVYWNVDLPNQFSASNEMPERTNKQFLILANENGIAKEIPNEKIEVYFDGNSTQSIRDRIFGIYENGAEGDGHEDRFVTIEQNIEGLKTTVGKVESTTDKLSEEVSSITQRTDEIDLSVKNMTTLYNEDKEVLQLREDLNGSIIRLNSGLGVFKSEITDYFKDNIVNDEEKEKITTQIALINDLKIKVLFNVDKVILIANKNGNTQDVILLNSAKQAIEIAHTNLVNNITNAISDGIITPTDRTVVIDAFAKYSLRVNEIKSVCDEIILLGFGGIVTEELANISVKSDEIKLSVSSTKEELKNDLSLQKIDLEKQIGDVSVALGDFENVVNTIFKDGIIDEAERQILAEKLALLEKEKLDIDMRYETFYNDVNLSGVEKTNLYNAYKNFTDKHDELKVKIEQVISDDMITDGEKISVSTLFTEYGTIVAKFEQAMSKALDIITMNKANAEIAKAKNEMQGQIDDVNNKVSDLDFVIDGTFENNLIDQTERKIIEQNIKDLTTEKVDIDSQFNQLYKNKVLINPLKGEFKSAYDGFNLSYNNLISLLTHILTKPSLINNEDRDNMTVNKNDMDKTLAQYVIKTNETIEFIARKESEIVKNDLNSSISDLNDKVDNLDFTIDGTFADNILDKAERKDIEEKLVSLEIEKIDVDSQYGHLYNSKFLDGTLKEDYKKTYDQFILKYDDLVKVIRGILEKTEFINNTDRDNVIYAQTELNVSIGHFVFCSNRVIEYISKKQTEASMQDFSSQLGALNDKVNGILDDVGGALSDDVLDKAERQVLKDSINALNVQKGEIDIQYNSVYRNINLTDATIRADLKLSYDTFTSKFDSLIASIDYLLNKVGNIAEEDRLLYSNAYEEYKVSIKTYGENLYKANDFITNKVVNDAKDDLMNEVNDLTNALGGLESTMNGAFKDGVLSEAEKLSISQNLNSFKSRKIDIDIQYETTHSNSNLFDPLKANLKNSYDDYVIKYNDFVESIEFILNKEGLIDNNDRDMIDVAINNHNTSLSRYTVILNKALDSITNNAIDKAKNDLLTEIGDIDKALGNLEETMNGVFKDGILSDSEKNSIKQHLLTLSKEKGDIDKQYTSLYANHDLEGISKSDLKVSYDNFIAKYNSLVVVREKIINKVGIIDSNDQNDLNVAFNKYRVASADYTSKAMSAVDAIAKKKAENESEKVDNKYAEIILNPETGIQSIVSSLNKQINATGGIVERLTVAEQTITPEGINNVIKQTTTVKDLQTGVSENKENLGQVNIKLDSITSRVESVETNQTETEGKVDSLETWKKYAEQKITDEAITNTVSKTYYSKEEIEEKNYQNESQVEQTVNGLEIKFTESGGYNLVTNSKPEKSSTLWTNDPYIQSSIDSKQIYHDETGWGSMFKLSTTGVVAGGITSQRFVLKPKTTYTINGWVYTDSISNGSLVLLRTSNFLLGSDNITDYDANIEVYPGLSDDKYTFFSKTITTGDNVRSGFIKLVHKGSSIKDKTSNIFFNQIMITKGELNTPWSPSPNEIYDGITSIDKEGVRVSMSNGEGEQGFAQINYEGIEIYDSKNKRKAWFGEDDTAFIDNLNSNDIQAPNVVKRFTGNANIYVAPISTGNGSGDDASNRCGGINTALSILANKYGRYIHGSANIYVANGTYSEDVIWIEGFVGAGQMNINLEQGVIVKGQWNITDSTKHVEINGNRTNNNTNDGARLHFQESANSHIYVRNSSALIRNIRAMSEKGKKYVGNFVLGDRGSRVMIKECDISRYSIALALTYSSTGGMSNCRGYVDTNLVCQNGSHGTIENYAAFRNESWSNLASEHHIKGSSLVSIYDPNWESPIPPEPPKPVYTWVENTFNASSLKTIPEGTGKAISGRNGDWGQGKWNTAKAHRGFATFTDAISKWCKGGRNFTVWITMTRLNTAHGYSNATPKPKIKEPNGNMWNSNIGFARGNTKTIALPATISNAIVNGHMRTLEMWAGGDNGQYSFYNNVSIKIKCEKEV